MAVRSRTPQDYCHLCQFHFEALHGTSDTERFCRRCAKTVYNWDMLPPDRRRELKMMVENDIRRICIAVKTRVEQVPELESIGTKQEQFQEKGAENSHHEGELIGLVSRSFFEE